MKHETNPITVRALALADLLKKKLEASPDAPLSEVDSACRTVMGLLDTAHTAESHPNPLEQFEAVAGLMDRAEKIQKDGQRKPWEQEEEE